MDDGDHGAHFAGGASGDSEEMEEFGGGVAFEALGDVVGDGEGGAVELVAVAGGEAFWVVLEEVEDAVVEGGGGLPGGEVFEAFVGHGVGRLVDWWIGGLVDWWIGD